jgi:hypothetical protein
MSAFIYFDYHGKLPPTIDRRLLVLQDGLFLHEDLVLELC